LASLDLARGWPQPRCRGCEGVVTVGNQSERSTLPVHGGTQRTTRVSAVFATHGASSMTTMATAGRAGNQTAAGRAGNQTAAGRAGDQTIAWEVSA
jgi:hypothetical protein